MKKRVRATALTLAVLLTAASTAFAETSTEEWDVTFTEENQLESNYTAANLSSTVFEMQPGDTVNLTLHLSNENGSPSNWYMSNEVLQSLEESGNAASGGAYEYELTYTAPNAEPSILYTSDTVGGEQQNSDRVGLKNATEGLEDFFYLDTLEAGERATVNLRVSLDGETQGNAYQDTLARLQLNFAVDPVVSREEVVVQENLTVVQTGDQNKSLPFLIAAGVSGLLLLILALLGTRERKRRRRGGAKKLLSLLLAASLLCAFPALSLTARAEDAQPEEPLTYRVRLFPGAQGAINAERIVSAQLGDRQIACPVKMENGVCVLEELPYGAIVTFHTDEETEGGVALNRAANADSKYYVRGVRESGQDNQVVEAASFTVTADQDYVVAYGIRGEMVAYTVRFEDEAGNELAPPLVRHGNVGDKPVVAYQYIEGYRPQAYNLTKTLDADAEKNVFTFTYAPIEVNVTVQTVVNPAVTVVPGTGGGPGGEALEDGPTPLAPTPEEVIDLDDTPLSGPGFTALMDKMIADFATALTFSLPLRIGISFVLIGSGVLLILLFIRKKEKKYDKDESSNNEKAS